VVLSLIALVIAALSLSISGVVAWHTIRRDSRLEARSVTVFCGAGITTGPIRGPGGKLTTNVLNVNAVNNGHRPVEIQNVIFDVSDGQSLFAIPMPDIGDKLPKHLTDGASATIYFDKAAIDAAVAKTGHKVTTVVVIDSQGGRYTVPYPA
jgi:hypothetical protein